MNVLELSEQEMNRRVNLQALKDMGINKCASPDV